MFSQGSSGVYSVAAGGGDPKPLTHLDASRKEAGHYWPWVLPDGEHFLYTSLSGRPDIHGIWVASLAAPHERHRLVAYQPAPGQISCCSKLKTTSIRRIGRGTAATFYMSRPMLKRKRISGFWISKAAPPVLI